MHGDKRGFSDVAMGDMSMDPSAKHPRMMEQQMPTVQVNPLTGTPYTFRFYELLERRQRLPAWSGREDFLRLMQQHQVIVLMGEAGSGKTTQLPQILLDAGYHVQNGQIKALTCVQPNNLAAMSAAYRVSEELEVPLGTFVAYSIRFEDKSSMETLLKFSTYDALLHEAVFDPLLDRYSVVMLDEAHTRQLSADTLFGILKRALLRRPELKLVIMAASMEVQRVQAHFGDVPLLALPARSHPVDIFYMADPERDYLKVAIRTVVQIHSTELEGDILLFLPYEEEIERACMQIRKEAARLTEHGDLIPVQLHTLVPLLIQPKIFEPAPGPKVPGGKGARKVIVATHVAETSVAIDNIVYVIDCGFVREKVYDPRIRLESTLVMPVSRASASQRALRAGTVRSGKCFRLYPEKAFQSDVPEQTAPEMLRSNLAYVVLVLKRLGIDDLVHFEFVDPPAPEAIMRAMETLNFLGCLDDEGRITETGEQASRFPVDPQLAKMLIDSPKHRCSNEALSIAAMLSVLPVFVRPSEMAKLADEAKSRFAHLDGDHLTLLNVFHAYKQHVQDGVDPAKFCGENFIDSRALRAAEAIREHLRRTMDMLNLQMLSTDFQDKEYYPNIRRCLVAGYFMQAAHLEKEKTGTYLVMRDDQEVGLHPTTCLQHKPEWVVYHEFVLTSRHFVRTVTQIRPEWLLDIAPHYYDVRHFHKAESRGLLEKLLAKRKQGQ